MSGAVVTLQVIPVRRDARAQLNVVQCHVDLNELNKLQALADERTGGDIGDCASGLLSQAIADASRGKAVGS